MAVGRTCVPVRRKIYNNNYGGSDRKNPAGTWDLLPDRCSVIQTIVSCDSTDFDDSMKAALNDQFPEV
ncbi:hypothetical protein CDV31_017236 [Fusarium ambrosium]|uniref:Uncharacterized protein n=1 Tax=Fusarium ambrosium TaxID=131363 RepID=A0A428RN76_9HYPO|nr:hypothetical protein CDV31_017236 [Fusarium ambrosium]